MIIRFVWMIEISLMLDPCELGLERLLRRVLHVRIQCCVNKHAAVIDLVLSENQIQITLDGVHCVIFLDLEQTFRMGVNFGELGLGRIHRRYFFHFNHAIQHCVALVRGAFGIFQRRKTIRTSN